MLHSLIDYINYSLYGFSEKEKLLSKMINENMIDRGTALHRIERTAEKIAYEKKVLEKIFSRLGLAGSMINNIL